MNGQHAHYPARLAKALEKLLISVSFFAVPGLASADNLPPFRHGLWEYNRTIEGAGAPATQKMLTVRKCIKPNADMKKQNEMLEKAGCKFSPVKKKGGTYSYSTDCAIRGAGRSSSRSVMTVESDSAYTVKVESESQLGGKKTRTSEVLLAKRVGDCDNP